MFQRSFFCSKSLPVGLRRTLGCNATTHYFLQPRRLIVSNVVNHVNTAGINTTPWQKRKLNYAISNLYCFFQSRQLNIVAGMSSIHDVIGGYEAGNVV